MSTDSNFTIPADDIRFPEAITIRHGEARVLSRLFIAAANMARTRGARAYAASRWPLDCAMNMINVKLLEKTHPSRYGYSEFSRSVSFPGSPLGDAEYAVCRLKVDEAHADFAKFGADWQEYLRVRQ